VQRKEKGNMEGNERMEEIMAQIKNHLKPTIDYGAKGNIHHYNRTWEKIDAWFNKWNTAQSNNGGLISISECFMCDKIFDTDDEIKLLDDNMICDNCYEDRRTK